VSEYKLSRSPCPHCGGTGRAVDTADGYRVYAIYQDGQELVGTYPTRRAAAARARKIADPSVGVEIVAPDGRVVG
jgi:hypothetical protein